MLSYQHGYHAGNFADVVKHLVLVRILNYLCQKDKPVFYLETHAGRGLYDLKSAQAIKTAEAREGIEALWPHLTELPELFSPYINTIRAYNLDDTLRYYPGSPVIALHQLRIQDRLYCCELHPAEFNELQNIKRQHRDLKFHVSHTDGLLQLPALLPPPERRGLVFIDPSYEIKTDYQRLPHDVEKAYRRFKSGIYCIWYPILNKQWHIDMLRQFAKIDADSLRLEFHFTHSDNLGMTGCGLWIINPPYVLAAELDTALSVLVKLLNPGVSSFELSFS